MKLLTGKRIGQSPGELAAAAIFSLLFHLIFLFAAIFFAFRAAPRVFVPPYYRVNLVDLPADAPLLPGAGQQPPVQPPVQPAPKPQPQKALKPKPAHAKALSLTKAPPPAPTAMPELGEVQKKQQPAPAETGPPAGAPAKRPEAVSVSASSGSQEFPFPPYVAIVRDKVERNWNPPPGARSATVKVTFRILRSGRIGDARLIESSGNFYFDQAAMRAILASSPFPPLPEGFFRDYETFSVDLMEKE